MFEETVVAEFSLGNVNAVEYRAKVAVRSGEPCVDIRKFRNGHAMPQGVQLPLLIAQRLFEDGPAIAGAIAKYVKAGAAPIATSATKSRRSER